MVHPETTSAEGGAGTTADRGEGTAWHFSDEPPSPLHVQDGERAFEVATGVADITLAHSATRTTFTAGLRLVGAHEELLGEATGEAVFDGSRWELAGRFRLPEGAGGFRATLNTSGTASNDDDRLSWQIDAVRD